MKRIAVFASGNGTNFKNIINDKSIKAEFPLLICDNAKAKVIKIAEENNIKTFVFSSKDFASKEEYEKKIIKELKDNQIDLIVLAGYMRILSPILIDEFKDKIINIHPSMLPLYKGKNAIEQAFEDGKNIFGVTIHYVNAEMDSGEIICQKGIEGTKNLTINEITKKVHELEYKLYPEVIKNIIGGEL